MLLAEAESAATVLEDCLIPPCTPTDRFFNNAGCFTETGPAAGGFLPGGLSGCTADTRVLTEGTAGFWFKLYDGSKEKVNKGRVQFGPQFSYVTRNGWSGTSTPNEPRGIDDMLFTSFRCYLP
jgi:hypothetical protein